MLRRIFVIAFAFAVAISGMVAYAATNRPNGFRTICKEGQTCTVNGSTNVAYGASGQFVQRTLSGSFRCVAATFGRDPVPSKKNKECSIPSGASGQVGGQAPAPAPAPRPAPAPAPAPQPAPAPAPAPAPSAPRPPATTTSCRPGNLSGVVDCRGAVVGTACDGQSESQQPVFTLAPNTTLRNVTLNRNAADGIHCMGNCTLENVVWQDVCEDAATMKGGPGTTMNIIGGSAANADDKVFQHNGVGSTVNITNFKTFGSIGKLYRSCGNCSNNGGPRRVNINNVQLETVKSSVAGVNANFGDVATIRNVQIKGFKAGKPKICEEFTGVQKGSEPKSNGEKFNTAACRVTPADVRPF